MPPSPRRRSTLRALALTATGAAALAVGAGAPSQGLADVASDRAAAQSLRQKVAAETARIERTSAGLQAAESRLAALDGRVATRQAQVQETQDDLVRARVRMARLERKAEQATDVLSSNLASAYESGRPDIVSVVLTSRGFADLLERVDFLKRVSAHNGHILDETRDAKTAVTKQASNLKRARERFSALAKEAVEDREQADVVRNAILRRKQAQLAARAGTSAQLTRVRGRIARLERAQAAAARAARAQATATQAAPRAISTRSAAGSSSSSSGGGSSSATSAAPAGNDGSAVARVVAAANEIATTPYVWGGGHGGSSGGYDCSGSLSYALAAGGLLSSPLTSGGFMSWGEPGPGKRITVYANAGHAYMVVDGRRYDTSALSGGGTRWTSEMRSSAGFVARHPAGY
jgi:peptidoglycan hydrolase CwlO-like protein